MEKEVLELAALTSLYTNNIIKWGKAMANYP
jgi:hypothetical protein